jgi:hypothetical protein
MTLADVLEWEYGPSALRWIECVVLDERQLFGAWEPSSLTHILPEELERIEFLGRGGAVGSKHGTMLRIYTRRFMTEMISRDIELRTPMIFGWTDADMLSPVHGVPAGCR